MNHLQRPTVSPDRPHGTLWRLGTCAAVLAVATVAAAVPQETKTVSEHMALQAMAFLDGLEQDQRASAGTAFNDAERRTWAFGPVQREGLALSGMNDGDMERLDALLDTALSSDGMAMWKQVRHLETVLRNRESRPGKPATHRDPDLYWLRVYGTPGETTAWSWRFEGHHLALHVTCAPGETPTVTPFFVGASPLIGVEDVPVTVEIFAKLQQSAAGLLESLGDLSPTPTGIDKPRDVRMGPGKSALPPADGLDAREFSKEQLGHLDDLLQTYLGLLDPELQAFAFERGLASEGDVGVHFAHWGPSDVSSARAWSLRTPAFSLELTTTSGPEHVHVLLRSSTSDFGGEGDQ